MAKAKFTRQKNGYFQTKRWDGTYNADGSKHLKNLRSDKSSKDLENMCAELDALVKQRQITRKTNVSFLEYSQAWIKTYYKDSPLNTRNMYENIVNKHLNMIDCPASEVSRAHYVTMLASISGSRTRQQAQMTFKQILQSLVHDKLLTPQAQEDIIADIPNVKYVSGEKRALFEYEVAAVKSAELVPQDKALLFILYGCGLRRQEALALTRFDINLTTKEISITKAIEFDVNTPRLKDTKNYKHRVVPIPDSIFPTIEQYVKSLHCTNLFSMADGTYMTKSSFDKGWKRIIKRMNEVSDTPITGLTPHIFRHNYCSTLCYKIPEISINQIAYLLGDSPEMVIKVYNHIMAEKEKPAQTVSSALAL